MDKRSQTTLKEIKTKAVIYAIVNQKGGVGKTTSAVNLSAALAEQNKRVLLVDIDAQANATTGIGLSAAHIKENVYHLLVENAQVATVIYPSAFDNLHVIPASRDLSGAEIELVELPKRESLLNMSLSTVSQHYDYIIIDCPPSLGLLTINALNSACKVIIPVQCEYFALEGLAGLMQTISRIQQTFNPKLRIGGIALTMYDSRTALNRDVIKNTKEHFKSMVFDTIIPRNIRLSEAPSHGLPISLYSRNSKGAFAYNQLAQEVINRG